MTEYYMSSMRRVETKQSDAIGKGKSCVELSKEEIKLASRTDINLSQKLPNIIGNYGLGVLLLNSSGQIKEEIDREFALELIDIAKRISQLTETEAQDLDNISSEITRICATALKISKEQRDNFSTLLKQYIVVELLKLGAEDKKIYIRKSGEMIDYKLNRVLKYLGINKKLEKISDFAIQYNKQSVSINGHECFTTLVPLEEKESKVIKIVRK